MQDLIDVFNASNYHIQNCSSYPALIPLSRSYDYYNNKLAPKTLIFLWWKQRGVCLWGLHLLWSRFRACSELHTESTHTRTVPIVSQAPMASHQEIKPRTLPDDIRPLILTPDLSKKYKWVLTSKALTVVHILWRCWSRRETISAMNVDLRKARKPENLFEGTGEVKKKDKNVRYWKHQDRSQSLKYKETGGQQTYSPVDYETLVEYFIWLACMAFLTQQNKRLLGEVK